MPKKKTPKKASESPETPPVKADPAAAAELAQQTGQDGDEQGSSSGSDQELLFGSKHEAEANTLVDRVEQMYAQQYGQPPNDQPHHVSAEVRDAFVKIHLVLKTARHDDEAATAILELLIKRARKRLQRILRRCQMIRLIIRLRLSPIQQPNLLSSKQSLLFAKVLVDLARAVSISI